MKILTPSFLLVAFFVIGGMMFKSVAPNTCPTLLHDDSIFVLTGDARRIPFAMAQAKKYADTDLYIIGAGGEFDDRIMRRATIESESKSTYQNAIAIRKIVENAGLDRIVVVTTVDHMNRAQYLLRHEMPDIEIVACPVRLDGMPVRKRLERWATEYIKYIVTMFGIKEG